MIKARWLAALVLAAAPAMQVMADTPAMPQDGIVRFYAYAYDLDSGKFLYTETHRQKIAGGKWVSGVISYWLSDGSVLGSKSLDFANDPFVPTYHLDLSKEGYSEDITDNHEKIAMQRHAPGKAVETATVKRDGMMVADSGFHNFLVAHFDELMAGQTLKFRFAAAGELDSFKFRAHRIEDAAFEGKTGVQFLVEPDSFLRFLAGPLHLLYDPATKRLMEYRGISNVRDPATHKTYNVRIDFYSKPPADGPARLPPLE